MFHKCSDHQGFYNVWEKQHGNFIVGGDFKNGHITNGTKQQLITGTEMTMQSVVHCNRFQDVSNFIDRL